MPLYEFLCPTCNIHKDAYRSVGDRHIHPTCDRCDLVMERRYSPARFNMPKLNFERKVDENRKRYEKLGAGSEPVGKETTDE